MWKFLLIVVAILAADTASLIYFGSYAGVVATLSVILASGLLGLLAIYSVIFSAGPFDVEGWSAEDHRLAGLALLAGVLLLLPGLVSDAIGLALLGLLVILRVARRLSRPV